MRSSPLVVKTCFDKLIYKCNFVLVTDLYFFVELNQKNDPKLRSYQQFKFQNTHQCQKMPLVSINIFLDILEVYQDFRIVGVVFRKAIQCLHALAPDKRKTSVYVGIDICHQSSIRLGPKSRYL